MRRYTVWVLIRNVDARQKNRLNLWQGLIVGNLLGMASQERADKVEDIILQAKANLQLL